MIFVDGAAGFVGRALALHLAEAGRAVRAVDRPGTELPIHAGIEPVHAELASADWPALLRGVSAGAHVAGLFDLGASPRALREANVVLARRAAEEAARAGVRRWVHVSSVTVIGRPRAAPAFEDDAGQPGNAYERSKAEGERAVMELAREGRLAVTSLRPSGIYGPRGRYGLAMMAAMAALASHAPPGRSRHRTLRGGTRMTHVHVGDVVRAATFLLDRERCADARVVGKAFHCADETPVLWGEIAGVIDDFYALPVRAPLAIGPARAYAMALGASLARGRLARANASLARRWAKLVEEHDLVPALVPRVDPEAWDYWKADHVYDTSNLRALGWRATWPDAIAGLRDTLAWYVRERWLPPPRTSVLDPR